MKKKTSIVVACGVSLLVAGCTGGSEMSPAEQEKMREGFTQTQLDESKLTPEQKAGLEKFRSGGFNQNGAGGGSR